MFLLVRDSDLETKRSTVTGFTLYVGSPLASIELSSVCTYLNDGNSCAQPESHRFDGQLGLYLWATAPLLSHHKREIALGLRHSPDQCEHSAYSAAHGQTSDVVWQPAEDHLAWRETIRSHLSAYHTLPATLGTIPDERRWYHQHKWPRQHFQFSEGYKEGFDGHRLLCTYRRPISPKVAWWLNKDLPQVVQGLHQRASRTRHFRQQQGAGFMDYEGSSLKALAVSAASTKTPLVFMNLKEEPRPPGFIKGLYPVTRNLPRWGYVELHFCATGESTAQGYFYPGVHSALEYLISSLAHYGKNHPDPTTPVCLHSDALFASI